MAIKRVLRYLRGTESYGITLNRGAINISGYVDSDYASNLMDRKSMSRFILILGGAACIWSSTKQPTVALSTCEAECYALTRAAKEIVWIRRVISEAGFKIDGPTLLWSDNEAAIKWVTNEKCLSARAKHIDVEIHFIRDMVKDLVIDVNHVASETNNADV